MVDESQFSNLRRDAFTDDVSDVFEGQASMATVPTSAIEDLGFTPEQVGFVRAGLYNAGFRTPPVEGDGVTLDDTSNKLPGWSYAESGGNVTGTWKSDSSGGNVTFTATGTTLGHYASVEQVVPVERLGNQGDVLVVRTRKTETSTTGFLAILSAAYLDSSGTVTGSSVSRTDSSSGSTVTFAIVPNGEVGIPTDAVSLRITVKGQVGGATVSGDKVAVNEVSIVNRMMLGGGIEFAEVVGNQTAFPNDGLVSGAEVASTQLVAISSIDAASRNIYGIVSTGVADGRILWLYNYDGSNSVVLVDESGSASSSAYRIKTPNLANLTIRPRGAVQLCYFGLPNGTERRWRVMSQV